MIIKFTRERSEHEFGQPSIRTYVSKRNLFDARLKIYFFYPYVQK